MSIPQPLAWQAGEGQRLSFANISLDMKADSAATNGRCSAFEYTAPAAFSGPPPHYHRSTEEIFYVLEGSLLFQLGPRQFEARAGAFVYVPAGAVHTFSNPAPVPARVLVVNTPGGFEGYFSEVARLMATEAAWPPSDRAGLLALMAKYDTFPAERQPA